MYRGHKTNDQQKGVQLQVTIRHAQESIACRTMKADAKALELPLAVDVSHSGRRNTER